MTTVNRGGSEDAGWAEDRPAVGPDEATRSSQPEAVTDSGADAESDGSRIQERIAKVRGASSSGLVGFPALYESMGIARLRKTVERFQSSLPARDLGRIFAATEGFRGILDSSAFSMATDAARLSAVSAAFGSDLKWNIGASIGPLFERPAWLSEIMAVSAMAAEHRTRIMDIVGRIDVVFPKLDFDLMLPELRTSMAFGSEALALAASFAPEVPDLTSTWRLLDAGRTTLGMSTAGLVLSRPEDDWEDDLLDDAEEDLITGPAEAGRRLRVELARLHPSLVNRLDGAWERVSRHGPDAASQAANSLVELIDWTLRSAAPDEDVLAWNSASGLSAADLHDGRPTRTLKVRFIVRNRPDAAAAEMYAQGIGGLLKVLQGHKHGAEEQQLAAVARLLPTVEAHLCFLLL